mgnify:FL=1|jgi:hypothetical protein|tara:strand:+ start:50 stop:526 length:477 start_codon:yes stop_codon:yes gene_type:complete
MSRTTFSGPVTSDAGFNGPVVVDSSTFNTGGAVTSTLTAAQSGTLFEVDGTGDIVVNMPALSTGNVGLTYEFFVTTAVGAGTTVTFVLPGSGVSNWFGALQLLAGSAANPVNDIAGDTLTLANSTLVNSRVNITCVSDDGTNSTWKAETVSSPVATIA